MTQDSAKKLSSELNDRLDSLFSDPDESAPDENGRQPATEADAAVPVSDPSMPVETASSDSPLFELQAIILSLDWEITDDTMNRLLTEIERLKGVYRREKLAQMFLQLHGSVGKYISTRKANAHPDSIKLLHSIFDGLQQMLTSSDMPEARKKKILSGEVEKFKKLKEQILTAKADGAASRKKAQAKTYTAMPPAEHERMEEVVDEPQVSTPVPETANAALKPAVEIDGDRLQNAIDELKEWIRNEIASLRNEILTRIEGR